MTAVQNPIPKPKKQGENPFSMLVRLIFVAFFDIGAGWFIYQAVNLGSYQLAAVVAAVFVLVNVILLLPQAYAYRWMVIGLAFMTLFVIYPMLFTIYVAFTNYGDGHLLSQQQALEVIQKETYLPQTGKSYQWTAYKSPNNDYALWLIDAEGKTYLAKVGAPLTPAQPGDPGIGQANSNGIPASIEGFTRLNPILAATDKTLPDIKFGQEGKPSRFAHHPKSPNSNPATPTISPPTPSPTRKTAKFTTISTAHILPEPAASKSFPATRPLSA